MTAETLRFRALRPATGFFGLRREVRKTPPFRTYEIPFYADDPLSLKVKRFAGDDEARAFTASRRMAATPHLVEAAVHD